MFLAALSLADAATLEVGPGRKFQRIEDANARVSDGDSSPERDDYHFLRPFIAVVKGDESDLPRFPGFSGNMEKSLVWEYAGNADRRKRTDCDKPVVGALSCPR